MPRERGVIHRWSPYMKRQGILGRESSWDNHDWKANLALEDRIPLLAASPRPVTSDTPGIELHQDLKLGEVSRHFDSQVQGTISGWMEHNLSFHGWGAAARVGGLGLGLGSLGLAGTSAVHLEMAAVGRDDLVSDGFLAVFDELGGAPMSTVDTLRVIAPGENASRQMVRATVRAMGRAMGEECWRDLALTGLAPLLEGAFETQVAYASDRLHAILRQPADGRPAISVLGTPVRERVLLGGAVQFAGDSRWHQLSPIQYTQDIVAEVWRVVSDEFDLSETPADAPPASAAGSEALLDGGQPTKECPYCGATVLRLAWVCRVCGKSLA